MTHLNNFAFGKPLISVIINCFNGEKYLREALDSIFAQTFEDWEIVFIDNCSTDSSVAIASDYGSRIKIFKTKENIALKVGKMMQDSFKLVGLSSKKYISKINQNVPEILD